MLRIKVSQLHNSDIVNIGKTTYTIELYKGLTWVFKKADSQIIIRKNKDKNLIKDFALNYCKTHNAELYIKNDSGKTEKVIDFELSY